MVNRVIDRRRATTQREKTEDGNGDENEADAEVMLHEQEERTERQKDRL